MAERKSTAKARKKTIKRATKKTNISKPLSNRIEKALLYLTNPRVREVIERRFGLKNGTFETLDSIGKTYGITRERVRQIQDTGLKVLKSEEVLNLFNSVFQQLDEVFAEHGNLMGEEYLYCLATNTTQPHPLRGHLYLLLTLGQPYQRIINDPDFYIYWMAHPLARDRAKKVVDYLISQFDKRKEPLQESEVLDILSRKHSNLPSNLFCVVLDIAKQVDKNNFGEIGLIQWPEISPQGVKDRAYLVLKRTSKPLHFTEITDLINKMGISPRTAYPQTVHNELIKDPRFVLVGRGKYALVNWGYEPGTVEQVIERILNQARTPLNREEILKKVLEQRYVKPTTIVLNLQRSPKIQRLGDGKYTLV